MSNHFPVKTKFDEEARKELLAGMEVVYKAVSKTLSPKGRNVAINIPGRAPQVIHDGVNTARKIDLDDPFKDIGAQMIKESSLQTGKKAGDGTTTSTVLAYEITKRGFEMISAGQNAMTLKKEVDDTAKEIVQKLKKLAKPVKTLQDKINVATISAGDVEIGKMIAEAVDKVGEDGIVTVEESHSVNTYVEYKQGFEFNRGVYSNYFITDQGKEQAVVDDPYILITDIKINNQHQILPFLQNMAKQGIKNIVIVGEVQEEALSVLVVNKIKGAFNVCAVQAPSYGDYRIQELEDIATLTGGKVISTDSGRELSSVVKEELGRATKFIASIEKSQIIDGKGTKKAIEARINSLKEAVGNSSAPYDKEIKKQRLSRLAGTVAIIYVGAHTDQELSDRKERIDDAVNATKCAVEEGIVAGGEITLLLLSLGLESTTTSGSRVLKEALKAPFKKLVENMGMDYAEVWGKISPFKYPYGIDVMDGEKKNMIESGIIDPVKVTRLALENAVSVATMAMTTEVLITEPYNKEK